MLRPSDGVVRTPEQTLDEAQRLLEARRPFHAHEVFEDAWKSASPEQSALWKGLAQLAVGLTHQQRGNPIGARRLLDRGAATLEPFTANHPFGLDVARLVAWARGSADDEMPLGGRAHHAD